MKRLLKTVILAAIGMVIGYFLGDGDFKIMMMISCAGIPAGWTFIGKHIGHTFVYGNICWMALWFTLQFLASLIVGWIVTIISIPVGIYEIVTKRELSF